jgi:hypothetical protein
VNHDQVFDDLKLDQVPHCCGRQVNRLGYTLRVARIELVDVQKWGYIESWWAGVEMEEHYFIIEYSDLDLMHVSSSHDVASLGI